MLQPLPLGVAISTAFTGYGYDCHCHSSGILQLLRLQSVILQCNQNCLALLFDLHTIRSLSFPGNNSFIIFLPSPSSVAIPIPNFCKPSWKTNTSNRHAGLESEMGNSNQNHNEIPLHIHQDGLANIRKKKWKITSVDEDVEKLETLCIADGNVKWLQPLQKTVVFLKT